MPNSSIATNSRHLEGFLVIRMRLTVLSTYLQGFGQLFKPKACPLIADFLIAILASMTISLTSYNFLDQPADQPQLASGFLEAAYEPYGLLWL
jgi:hypothetical protein